MSGKRSRRQRQNLIGAREDKGLSQNDLAELAGTTQAYISQLESCYRNPGRALAKRIAKVLGKDDAFLFDEGIVETVHVA